MAGNGKPEYGSDVIVDVLRELDIEYIALNPGATFRGIHDSMVNYQGNTRPEMIICSHEEIAVAIAHGYGKAAGKPMGAFVHNIVGLLHASMAVFNAWCDHASVLLMGATGPVAADERRPWIDWIHTANVQGNAVRDYTKWDDQPASIGAAVESLIRAHRITSAEPKGPVYVCFDAAIQEQKLDGAFTVPDVRRFPQPTRVQGDNPALERAADLLVNAKNPVVVADFLSRSEDAMKGLIRLAESLSIPVIEGDDLLSFPTRHPLYAAESKRELLGQADVVLALDIYDLQQMFSGQDYASRQIIDVLPGDAKLIDVSQREHHIGAWVHDYGPLYPTELSLTADTAVAVPALADLVQRRLDDGPDRAVDLKARWDHVASLHAAAEAEAQEAAKQAIAGDGTLRLSFIAQQLWDVVKDRDWVIGNGDLRGWMRRLWDMKEPYQVVDSRGGAGLGQGFGHAIGVALANRDKGRVTINVQSDGDFLFTPAAVWTAVHHEIPMLVVMYNNRTYGNDLGHQALVARHRGRPEENKTVGINIDNPNVDFASMARSFGAWAEGPIEKPEELKPALERALHEVVANKRVALVDVITEWR